MGRRRQLKCPPTQHNNWMVHTSLWHLPRILHHVRRSVPGDPASYENCEEMARHSRGQLDSQYSIDSSRPESTYLIRHSHLTQHAANMLHCAGTTPGALLH